MSVSLARTITGSAPRVRTVARTPSQSGFFFDDIFYFGTGRSTRKARNLAHNPALSIHLESGDDVVILEGTATEIAESDKPTLAKLDSASRQKYKMPLMTIPNETVLYAVRPRVVLAWTERGFPKDATRWQLDDALWV